MKPDEGRISSQERPLYARATYASAFGLPALDVPEWQTALLQRPIPGSEWHDALGCYPLCTIALTANLESGLERLRAHGMVSVALVADPTVGLTKERLLAAFPVCHPFKQHYLLDRGAGEFQFSTTHRRWIRKAIRLCRIEQACLSELLGEWDKLYRGAIERHGMTGLQKFSSEYFRALSRMPEIHAFCARIDGEPVAISLWVRAPGVAYYHLGASNEKGYRTQAMYGVFAAALEYFADVPIIHFGGAAGIEARSEDGLVRFKRGFANREVEAYFCGACLDRERYATLTQSKSATSYFPAYRTT